MLLHVLVIAGVFNSYLINYQNISDWPVVYLQWLFFGTFCVT